MTTISALATLSGVALQLQAHIGMGMNIGLTEAQLLEFFNLMEKHIGINQAEIA